MRSVSSVVLAVTALIIAVPATAQAEPSDSEGNSRTVAQGVFTRYQESAAAITYAPELVPPGARMAVFAESSPGEGTSVAAVLEGLRPNRTYGAHVHTRPCGAEGSDAGPHFQRVPAPEGVSGDPAYANPSNEIWLDFRTDAAGNAVSGAFGEWNPHRGDASSVVIHEHRTRTAPGAAGEAGARLACLNVAF
ncbi:superoxide dismutase, Cu-Zn family [Actinopolyspora mzabensis]|uniref:Superoxide dismutase, Cu-Zn family n=1 Tax=Actinopolyspora mzabensis TaxID=995066 RepID=A0A1G8X114_ACTMZ|nr:superoxide dismutase family protein [Actinopolyspora mzabensis]SDJ84338.1 superoxide dismutase, Cu-Zn family [Actinopolyspora mzabensis]